MELCATGLGRVKGQGTAKRWVTVCVKMPLGCVNVGALTKGEIEVRIEDRAKC